MIVYPLLQKWMSQLQVRVGHTWNPALGLKGGQVGLEKRCSYEQDLAVTFLISLFHVVLSAYMLYCISVLEIHLR